MENNILNFSDFLNEDLNFTNVNGICKLESRWFYYVPDDDNEIRTDIKHLIQVLSEFTTNEDRLLSVNKFAAPQSVDFPINAYKSVIEYYFSIALTNILFYINIILMFR